MRYVHDVNEILRKQPAQRSEKQETGLALGLLHTLQAAPDKVQVGRGVWVVAPDDFRTRAVVDVQQFFGRYPDLKRRLEQAASDAPVYIVVGEPGSLQRQFGGQGGPEAVNFSLPKDRPGGTAAYGAHVAVFDAYSVGKTDPLENETSEIVTRQRTGGVEPNVQEEAISAAISTQAETYATKPRPTSATAFARQLQLDFKEELANYGSTGSTGPNGPEKGRGKAAAARLNERLADLNLAKFGDGEVVIGFDAAHQRFNIKVRAAEPSGH
jgi:hypothetical protein